jgi:hypothetical protein
MPVQLPFLVVHGETIYTAAAIAVALFSVLGLWRRRLRLAKERTKDSLKELGAVTSPANFAAGSPAVLKGVIEFPKNKQLVGTLIPHWKDDTSDLVDLDAGVTLKGESSWPCEGLAEIVWAADLSREFEKLFVRVHPGEEVHVRGTLQALPSSSKESASYREASIEWRLVGTLQDPLQIVSCRPPRPRLGPWGVVWSALVGLAAFALGAQIIGASAMGGVENREVRVIDGKLDYPAGPIIGAAMPFHREDALHYFTYELRDASLGELGTRAGIELDILGGECAEAITRALEGNLWDEAKAVASRCPTSAAAKAAAYKVSWVSGDFEEASRLVGQAHIYSYRETGNRHASDFALDWKEAANMHILAGNYSSAAKVLEREAEAWLGSTPDGDDAFTQKDLDRIGTEMRCLATAARHLAGESVKLQGSTVRCRVLQTEQLEPEERRARLAKLVAEDEVIYSRSSNYVEFLSAEAGHLLIEKDRLMSLSEPSIGRISAIVSHRHIFHVPLHLGVLQSAFEAVSDREDARQSRAAFGLELAYWKALAGDDDLAQKMFLDAKENVLLGASEEARVYAKELESSANPLEAEHLRSLTELLELQGTYKVLDRLTLIELGLAALASRRGALETAQRHVDMAAAYTTPDRRDDYFAEGGYAQVDAILGKAPEDPYAYGIRCGLEPEECTPTMRRAGWYMSMHPGYLDQAVAEILERKAYVDTIDAPQWQAELQVAVDAWSAALYDRDRSLLLGLLDSL